MNQASLPTPSPPSWSGRWPSDLIRVIDRIAPSSDPATRRALVDAAGVRTFVRDEVIVLQGERAAVGLVIEGVVAARRTTADGRAVMPLILGRGAVLGPMVLVGQEALFDFIGLGPGSVALWSATHLRTLAASDAGLALGLLDNTLRRFSELTARLDALHYQDARGRVARVLIEHRELCFGDRPQLARTQLSMLIGTSREMTRRVLSRLEDSGAIGRVGRTGLVLRDAARLRELAGLGPRVVDVHEDPRRADARTFRRGTSSEWPGTSSSPPAKSRRRVELGRQEMEENHPSGGIASPDRHTRKVRP